MSQTDLDRVKALLAGDTHCKKVSAPVSTQVMLLPKASLAAVKKQLKRG